MFPDPYDWYPVRQGPFVFHPVNPCVVLLHGCFLFVNQTVSMIEVPVNLNDYVCVRTVKVVEPAYVLCFILSHIFDTENVQELRGKQVFKF